MATTSCISGARLCKPAELLREIKIRLQLTETESQQLLVRFRALPADHPRRFELLRALEIAAAIAGELTDLAGLIEGKVERTDRTDRSTEPSENRPPRRRGRPRELALET